jgi:hypothetical protein
MYLYVFTSFISSASKDIPESTKMYWKKHQQGKKYVDNMYLWVWTFPWSHSQANTEKPENKGKQRVERKNILPPMDKCSKDFSLDMPWILNNN